MDRTVALDSLDLTPEQRRLAERHLTVRSGHAGEPTVDREELWAKWTWIVGDERPYE
jgi:hypothetical protein